MASANLPVLELLFEQPGLFRQELPRALAEAYSGGLGFSRPRVAANFVASVDGVVALADAGESGHVISMDSVADKFVMGLLRAFADVVMVGAGTFRKSPTHLWRPGNIYPPGRELFAELRASLGLAPEPRFVLISGSGAVDGSTPALDGALVVTTRAGAPQLEKTLPASAELSVVDGESVSAPSIVRDLEKKGARFVLTEGGPSLATQLLAGGALDELFLTLSPALFGRFSGDGRKALTDVFDLGRIPLDLLSLRRAGSHLFLRYAITTR